MGVGGKYSTSKTLDYADFTLSILSIPVFSTNFQPKTELDLSYNDKVSNDIRQCLKCTFFPFILKII